MEKVEIPYRLERLQKRVERLNGAEISEAESRKLIGMLAEAVIDLWRDVLHIKEHRCEPEDEKQDWFKVSVLWFADRVLPPLIVAGFLGAVGFWAVVNNHIQIASITP